MPIVSAENKFVSRAEGKLEGAVRAFRYDFRNKTVLDIGSSTGGFTELALKLGAKKVIAIEKGTNQMKAPLRFDARVDLREKTDFFDVAKDDFVGEIDAVVADVSFVSLTKILAHAKKIIGKDADFLVMLKPQFEAEPSQLVKGVVKNEKMRRDIMKNFENWLKMNGFLVLQKRDNDVAGKKGNLERFYLLKNAKKA
ncbi:TlyA family rRNA (cytidine-2'-O)-methyltransferase [Candidatus Saccharibacteria bacterium]|nr:TlyA family rRNA (cytidine-2'-O)-methyltransferase [Candidatus Saccharibacteria bacterium]